MKRSTKIWVGLVLVAITIVMIVIFVPSSSSDDGISVSPTMSPTPVTNDEGDVVVPTRFSTPFNTKVLSEEVQDDNYILTVFETTQDYMLDNGIQIVPYGVVPLVRLKNHEIRIESVDVAGLVLKTADGSTYRDPQNVTTPDGRVMNTVYKVTNPYMLLRLQYDVVTEPTVTEGGVSTGTETRWSQKRLASNMNFDNTNVLNDGSSTSFSVLGYNRTSDKRFTDVADHYVSDPEIIPTPCSVDTQVDITGTRACSGSSPATTNGTVFSDLYCEETVMQILFYRGFRDTLFTDEFTAEAVTAGASSALDYATSLGYTTATGTPLFASKGMKITLKWRYVNQTCSE